MHSYNLQPVFIYFFFFFEMWTCFHFVEVSNIVENRRRIMPKECGLSRHQLLTRVTFLDNGSTCIIYIYVYNSRCIIYKKFKVTIGYQIFEQFFLFCIFAPLKQKMLKIYLYFCCIFRLFHVDCRQRLLLSVLLYLLLLLLLLP